MRRTESAGCECACNGPMSHATAHRIINGSIYSCLDRVKSCGINVSRTKRVRTNLRQLAKRTQCADAVIWSPVSLVCKKRLRDMSARRETHEGKIEYIFIYACMSSHWPRRRGMVSEGGARAGQTKSETMKSHFEQFIIMVSRV